MPSIAYEDRQAPYSRLYSHSPLFHFRPTGMTQMLLYYSLQFVTLHQKNPGYNPGNDQGNPLLDIGGVQTPFRKYSLEVGFGDPGENPAFDTFDYSEWAIGFATFIK